METFTITSKDLEASQLASKVHNEFTSKLTVVESEDTILTINRGWSKPALLMSELQQFSVRENIALHVKAYGDNRKVVFEASISGNMITHKFY